MQKQRRRPRNAHADPTPTPTPTIPSQVAVWLTTADRGALFNRQNVSRQFGANTNTNPTILVDTTQTYQTMDSFGYTLTGGSAQVMSKMSTSARRPSSRSCLPPTVPP